MTIEAQGTTSHCEGQIIYLAKFIQNAANCLVYHKILHFLTSLNYFVYIKDMNKIIRKIIASLFISSAAFLWTACSDDSTNNTTDDGSSHPSIDIEKALLDLEKRDTTGLIGTTVSGYDACITRIITNERSDYFFLIEEKGQFEAGKIVETQIGDFLESSKGASLSDNLKNCYTLITLLFTDSPESSPICSSYAEELTIDNQNINDLLEADEMSRQAFKSTLERVDELLAECESPE